MADGCVFWRCAGKYPTFGGELVQYDWLSDEHLVGAKRLLLVLKQFEEKMNCKPHSSRFSPLLAW